MVTGMDVKQPRSDRPILRLLGTLGVCAVVALGLLGVHGTETAPGSATTTARHAVSQAVTP
jgi:hypothetical protein